MRSTRHYPAMQMKVGTLIVVGISLALLGMIFPTKGINPFSPKFILRTHFPDVVGLRPSSPVWFSGVEVGEVIQVEFVPESDPPQLQVVMRIERKVKAYIKTDSKATIRGLGLLGDTYVDISRGSADAMSIPSGGMIVGVLPRQMKDDMDALFVSATVLLDNLEDISQTIREGRGSLGQLVQDPALYQELRDAVSELKQFVSALNTESGTIKKMLSDPTLYEELVATVQDIRIIVADLKKAEQNLLSPETRQTLDETVKTASRVVKRVGEYQEKIDKVRFNLSFGLSKYEAAIASGHVHLQIWPGGNRYYLLGLQKISELYGRETDQTTFDAQLAWRIWETPFFIRGGLIRDEFFVAGLDLRLWADTFNIMLDAYRVELNPLQMDFKLGLIMLDLIEITAGVEDVWQTPFYKLGLTIHFRDEDLLTVLMKSQF